ncbi:hypothetical protein KUTeg_020912 [Tegillarca granosa]|uniref:Cadherin domain-containing protein n=1 Tax=Tegillarca granosa TaxID=220873 RepID=A0ABQ9E9T3_TEGGR|nr:hypothetical protein KUTeg_020912 [Tegillarca granosa]
MHSGYNKAVPENIPIGTTVLTVSATDADFGDTWIYGLDKSYAHFKIDPSTGELLLLDKLDWETKSSHSLLVTATDSGGLVATSTVVITSRRVSVYEEQTSGSTVKSITALDKDSGINGHIKYKIISGNGISSFRIDSVTGKITTTKKLDYEIQNFYDIVIQAADGASPSLSATTLLKVTLLDINDNPPVFIPIAYTLSVFENIRVGSTVTTVTASDADSSSHGNNAIHYSLQSSKQFKIDPSTGIITTSSILDRETTSSYDLVIFAIDGGSRKQTGTCTITVMVFDVNDNPPVVNGAYVISIPEDTPINMVITTVNATDSDEGDNSRLNYEISKGNAHHRFKIEKSLGLIQTAKTLDREDVSIYKLEITISDHGTTPRSTTTTVTVSLLDVNDNAPIFTKNNFAFTVDENVRRGTPVGTLTANDHDTGNNAYLKFEILGFWTGIINPFYIEPRSGRIRVNGHIDRELSNFYNLWCRVSDSGIPLLSSDVNVSITILDVNDNYPLFSKALYSNKTTENSFLGTSVLSVFATDEDIGGNAYLSYSIDLSSTGGPLASQYFQINSKSGEISVKQKIDREINPDFNFTIKVSDAGSPKKTDSALIFITVEDENDNAPMFLPAFYNSEVPYTDTCKTTVVTLTATDDDIGINSQTTYQLTKSINSDLFSLSSTTGEQICYWIYVQLTTVNFSSNFNSFNNNFLFEKVRVGN